MCDRLGYKLLTSTLALLGLVLALGLAGCDEDDPAVTPDTGVDSGPTVDQKVTADQAPPDQKAMWPDSAPDSTPDKGGYSKGAPFGCSGDRDCFGQKCCPTPWGVKLCAPSCDLKL